MRKQLLLVCLNLIFVCRYSGLFGVNSEADVSAAGQQGASNNTLAVLFHDLGLLGACLAWFLDVDGHLFARDDAILRLVQLHVEGKHELAILLVRGSLFLK